MNRKKMIKEIHFCFWYFGEVQGSCNSGPYMGGMAHAELCRKLGISYPGNYELIFNEGTDKQLQIMHKYIAGGYLKYAKEALNQLPNVIRQHQTELKEWKGMI